MVLAGQDINSPWLFPARLTSSHMGWLGNLPYRDIQISKDSSKSISLGYMIGQWRNTEPPRICSTSRSVIDPGISDVFSEETGELLCDLASLSLTSPHLQQLR